MNEQKSRFPFNVIEGMMPLYPLMAVMGWAIVVAAFLVGALALSPAQAAFFSDAKAVREAAGAGSLFVQANTARHAIEAWLPSFKFFGMGLGLLAITMALGIIARRLRKMGQVILGHIPADRRPAMPSSPKRVRVFQLSAVTGLMVLLAVLVIGIVLAAGVVPAYWNHSIAGELNPAPAGSLLLAQLAVVKNFHFWLNPLRMVGMSLLFTAISVALTVILGTLRLQAGLLVGFYRRESGRVEG